MVFTSSLIVCTGVIITVLSSQFTVTMAVLHNIWHWRCMLFYSFWFNLLDIRHISALMLLVGRQERHLACKKTEWWGAGMVICLELGADLHMAQLMPLPLTVSCYSKIQIGFIFLVPAHLGSPGQRAIKRVCVCVCVCVCLCVCVFVCVDVCCLTRFDVIYLILDICPKTLWIVR